MSQSAAKCCSNKLGFWVSCSLMGVCSVPWGWGSSPTAGATGLGGARAERPPCQLWITALPMSAQPARQRALKSQRWGQQLPWEPQAVTLHSSAWACASHVVLDPLPYVCGLTSFSAVHLVPPQDAEINKVTCTNTPCLSSSLPPALTLFKWLLCPHSRTLLWHPYSALPPGWTTLVLHCNQNESQEVVLQLVRNEMLWWLKGLGEGKGQVDYPPHIAHRFSIRKIPLQLSRRQVIEITNTVSSQDSTSHLLPLSPSPTDLQQLKPLGGLFQSRLQFLTPVLFHGLWVLVMAWINKSCKQTQLLDYFWEKRGAKAFP